MISASYRCVCRILLAAFLVFCFAMPAFAGHGVAASPKKGILLVAFGTSIPEARVAFDAIDAQVRAEFPDVPVRWAFTSNIIRKKLEREAGQKTLSVPAALSAMLDDGFTDVAVQSLHTIPGEEFHRKVLGVVSAFRHMPGGFRQLTVGAPLMASDEDMRRVVKAVASTVPSARQSDEPVVLMGHGTHHPGNIYYPGLQWYLDVQESNIFIGTVEGTPRLDDIRERLRASAADKVWLMPMMSVAGDHARNDMAGPEADSWKSVLEQNGYDVAVILKGTAEYPEFVSIWIEHLKGAFDQLN